MQKLTNTLLLAILVAVIFLSSAYGQGCVNKIASKLLPAMGGAVATFSIPDFSVDTVTHSTATTSASALPVKILDDNLFRQYAEIINDSDTILYIGLTTASTTVLENTGIRLAASGGSLTIDQDNLYTGEVWVASSTAGKLLLISEI